MKTYLYTILFSFFSLFTFSQSKLDSLENEKVDLKEKIVELNQKLENIEGQILKFQSEEILTNVKTEPLLGIAKKGAFILDKPNVTGKIESKLEEDTPIQILDYFPETRFYQICINNRCGFMAAVWVKSNAELSNFKSLLAESQKQEAKEKYNNNLAEKKEERKLDDARMLKKYGKSQYDKMKKRLFWIGMNEEMLLFSLGEPKEKNSSGGSWGTLEQWVYSSGTYIYLENGKVTAFQQ